MIIMVCCIIYGHLHSQHVIHEHTHIIPPIHIQWWKWALNAQIELNRYHSHIPTWVCHPFARRWTVNVDRSRMGIQIHTVWWIFVFSRTRKHGKSINSARIIRVRLVFFIDNLPASGFQYTCCGWRLRSQHDDIGYVSKCSRIKDIFWKNAFLS